MLKGKHERRGWEHKDVTNFLVNGIGQSYK